MSGFDCGQCGGQCDMCRRAEQEHRAAQERAEALPEYLALGAFAAGVALLVFYVVPHIEIAIALVDRITGGL